MSFSDKIRSSTQPSEFHWLEGEKTLIQQRGGATKGEASFQVEERRANSSGRTREGYRNGPIQEFLFERSVRQAACGTLMLS